MVNRDSKARVFVIVLNWNRWKDTLQCLASLETLDYPNYEIVVVDNGSEDESQARIEAARPELTLLQAGANLGYAGGNNIGIRYALEREADYVWVLNNDALVEPDTLTVLVDAACSGDRVGVVGTVAVTRTESGVREIETSAFRWRGERMDPILCFTREMSSDESLSVDSVAGASVLLNARMLEQTGAFDERFFHYYEDVELCQRASCFGWEVVYACRSRVWHDFGSSMSNFGPQARYYYIRNWLLFSRWTGRGGLVRLLQRDPLLTIGRISSARWLFRGRVIVAAAGILGTLDAIRGRYGKRDLPGWTTRPVPAGLQGRP